MSGVPAIQKYALPPGQQQPGLPELINLLVNFVLFVLAYVNSGLIEGVVKGVVFNLYHIGSAQPDQQLAQEIGNPQTVDDFKKGVEDYVRDSDLGQFFPPGNAYLQKVAKRLSSSKTTQETTSGSQNRSKDSSGWPCTSPSSTATIAVPWALKSTTNKATRLEQECRP